MKILVASDIHGSAYWCRRLMEALDREAADTLLLLGDVLYHGPRNDLPQEYAPKEVFAMLNACSKRVFGVRGNCDAEIDQMVLRFPLMADYCLLPAGERLIFVTHGHVFHEEQLPPLRPGDILLHGHTHETVWRELPGGTCYFNPGSVSLPKNGTAHAYMTIDEKEILWKDMDGGVLHRFTL